MTNDEMMSPKEFKALPAMVRQRVLRECGLSQEVIDALAYPVQSMADPVPARRIACLRLPVNVKVKNGRFVKRHSLGRRFYRKQDLPQFLGPEYLTTNGHE